jgi:hypothetical protein
MVGVSKIDGPYLARIIAEAAANGTFVEIDFDGVVNGAKKPKKSKVHFVSVAVLADGMIGAKVVHLMRKHVFTLFHVAILIFH